MGSLIIKKQYINKVKDIFIKYKQIKQNTLLIFNKINDDKIFIKFINKERPPNDLRNAYKDLERAKNNIKKKAKKDYLIKYNFNAKTEEEQNLNYNHYVKLYDELNAFNYLKNNFEDLADDFKIEFSKNFSVYFTLIDRYAELNITKNYFILLSILFQIIGLVSLIILFRVLVIENK